MNNKIFERNIESLPVRKEGYRMYPKSSRPNCFNYLPPQAHLEQTKQPFDPSCQYQQQLGSEDSIGGSNDVSEPNRNRINIESDLFRLNTTLSKDCISSKINRKLRKKNLKANCRLQKPFSVNSIYPGKTKNWFNNVTSAKMSNKVDISCF